MTPKLPISRDARNAVRKSKKKQRACVPSTLMIFVNRKLSKKRDRHWIGLVALLRFGQERALDLRRAQGHVTDDVQRGRMADHIGTRDAGGVVGPGMPAEPLIQRVSATIELGKSSDSKSGRGGVTFCHVGALRARSFSP